MHRLLILLSAASALTACNTTSSEQPSAHRFETFDSAETHSRAYDATDGQACEAARRALLSQGYVIDTAKNDFVSGRKQFQPEREQHVELVLRVSCARQGDEGRTAIVFVSAVEDRYTVTKNPSSASLGVSVLGSVSVPLSGSDAAMVKTGSETVAQADFYRRFFALVDQYLGR